MNSAMEFAQKARENLTRQRTLKETIPKEYHEFLSVFDKKAAEQFPPSQSCDHAIKLKLGFIPKDCKVYPLS